MNEMAGTTLAVADASAASSLAGRGADEASLPAWRRADWLAGREALRAAAAEALGVARNAVAVGHDDEGRPRAETLDASTSGRCHVSVAHRDGLGAAVANRRRRVGVDLEQLIPIPAEAARYFLTERERKLDVPDRATLWALKEAAWKALECSDSIPFTALELQVEEGGVLRGVSLDGQRYAAGSAVSSPWPGYVLAVVWLEGEAE
jgi:phosphopantetheinyl transferase